MKDVIVIGAGVAGLVLARELARLGIIAKVYDSKKAVGDGASKASGIISTEGIAATGISYEGCIVNTLDGATFHSGRSRLRVKAGSVRAYVVDRALLAEECLREAESAGAEIELGRRLSRDDISGLVHDRSNIVVGADGAVSTVASSCGFPPIREFVMTYKAEYDGAGIPDSHSVELFFASGVSNRFFGWTAPYSSEILEAGIGISSFARMSSAAAFNSFVAGTDVHRMLDGSRQMSGHASVIPLSTRGRTVKENVLLVGDAAGQVKATTGGGIVFGSACARVAARCISDHIRRGLPLSRYEREWRRSYGLDLAMHRALHSLYSSIGESNLGLLFRLSKLLGSESFLSAYGDMDRPSLMLRRFFLRSRA
ncbi:MAG: NAD(P)/FAD-dependent oxidoreductase [Candidatus Marsarchaeota archaeon]|jgi:flavin-dependent dehydrogenase|nr:NAD(P)/FAD-dependent oxidoreductase [Candidatus Marsarchaeota archaeon]